ncbi:MULTISPECIES: nuclear transport factor 2 family protein [unclassified Achromobacter]|uniref:nuclear transport factor 2 family protein n=1 Tax=unclassified Achromobacter TaxID=2626865 RepID=UPI000B515BFC|nr:MULTISPECIES: nuclear transport factor 2 family protein [unclassified Achromobacter]OWT76910.1 hypothetical protein CEY04_12930 [Achromobacter sp. HZ28]OWT77790.1 hypothetical protein CEY05_07425 [Achromobacter sp. HZ34]
MHEQEHARKNGQSNEQRSEQRDNPGHGLDTATVQACLATVYGFFDALDVRDHARARFLFTEDGQWQRGGATLTGPAQIGEALAQRPDTRRTFHAVCNPILERLDEDTVLVRFYLLAYDATVGQAPEKPAGRATEMRTERHTELRSELPTPLQPAGIRRCEDRLCREHGAWRIARKSSTAHLPVPAAA